MTTSEQIAEWLAAPEGRQLEFKAASTGYHFDKLVDYCVALANEGGGRIILGITDRRPRDVVGTAAFAEPGRTEAGLYERLRHQIRIEETRYRDKRLLIVHVPGRLPGTAWEHNGRYLRRAGDDLVSIPPQRTSRHVCGNRPGLFRRDMCGNTDRFGATGAVRFLSTLGTQSG